MKKLISTIIIIVTVVLTFPGCSDDDPPTNTELLAAKPWKFVSVQVKTSESDPWQDPPLVSGISIFTFDPCSQDDITTFFSNGDWQRERGQVHCSVSEETLTGTWT